MGVCSRCLTAIRNLGPHDWPRRVSAGSKVILKLPQYHRQEVLGCWICTKFSEWLESEDEAAFVEWRTQSLEVEYAGSARVEIEGMRREDALPPFFMSIFPPSHNVDSGCPIELNFISRQGEKTFHRITSSLDK